jgi:hypothetical protein
VIIDEVPDDIRIRGRHMCQSDELLRTIQNRSHNAEWWW